MLLVNKDNIEDLNPTDIEEMVYCPVEEKDKWKIDVAKALMELQYVSLILPNLFYSVIMGCHASWKMNIQEVDLQMYLMD